MIKAKKSLLIALFAALMIFAFGATSAFAAQTESWSADYSKVTITGAGDDHDGYTYNTIRYYDNSTGAIVATTTGAENDVAWTVPTATAYFYDMSEATLTGLYGTYNNGAYTKPTTITLNVPSYVANKAAAAGSYPKASAFTTSGLTVGLWTGEVKENPEYDSAATTEQKFEVTLPGTYASTPDGKAATTAFIKDAVKAKSVTVLAKAAKWTDVKYYKDEVPADGTGNVAPGTVTIPYDGAAHKLVTNTVGGFTVSWEVYNKSTGQYDAATECPAVTNVGDEVSVKATVNDGYPVTDTRHDTTITPALFNVKLAANTTAVPKFGFDKDGDKAPYEYAVEGAEFDAYSYIVVATASTKDEDKAAVKANEEELLAYFKDFYEVTAKSTKADPNKFELAMEAKKLSADEVKALEKKYEALMKNFNVASGSVFGTDATTGKVFTNNNAVLAPEIEFIDSPTAVKYKAKKLKKKAASFTVTAVSSNNEAVTYKLINAPEKITIDKATGEITLNKGLKKGKYKITVKAYIPKAYTSITGGVFYPSETHDILIKVKK